MGRIHPQLNLFEIPFEIHSLSLRTFDECIYIDISRIYSRSVITNILNKVLHFDVITKVAVFDFYYV